MADFTFDANTRHIVDVIMNGDTGKCDVLVSDKLSNNTFSKSMTLDEYNRLVDWLRDNDHGFTMMSIRSYF